MEGATAAKRAIDNRAVNWMALLSLGVGAGVLVVGAGVGMLTNGSGLDSVVYKICMPEQLGLSSRRNCISVVSRVSDGPTSKNSRSSMPLRETVHIAAR